jgi:autoinducer 2-degrading protein
MNAGESEKGNAVIAMVVSVRIRPERRDEFLLAIEEDSRGSREDEPGCLRFDVLQDSQDPEHYFFYEIYRDDEALAAHRKSPHYRPWSAFVASGGLQSPAEVAKCVTRFPKDDSWR